MNAVVPDPDALPIVIPNTAEQRTKSERQHRRLRRLIRAILRGEVQPTPEQVQFMRSFGIKRLARAHHVVTRRGGP